MHHHWNDGAASEAIDLITEFRLNFSAKVSSEGSVDNTWWSALLMLKDTSVTELDRKLKAEFEGNFLIPQLHLEGAPEDLSQGHVVTIYAQRNVLEALNKIDNDFGVSAVTLGSVVPESILNFDSATGPCSDEVSIVSEETVTMAVIDDGIAFAHNLFRHSTTKSRVERMYIMDLEASKDGPTVPTGQELLRCEIDNLLEENTHSGLLDEHGFYRQVGAIDHVKNYRSTVDSRRSHGTHVMGLAAGYEMGSNQTERPIVAVQLPTRVTADTSGQSLAPSLGYALFHILSRSRNFRLSEDSRECAPLVVNFSYGEHGGPHDGSGTIAHMIDQQLKEAERYNGQKVRFVLPAGNANLSRCHAAVSFDDSCKKDHVTLDLNIVPDDYTCSYVEMWMPFSSHQCAPDFVKVSVATPDGAWSRVVDAECGSRQILCDSRNREIGELSYSFRTKNGTDRGLILLKLHPSSSFDPHVPLAPSGRWKIKIEKAEIREDQKVEVWVRRDDTLPGYAPFGRQAYFDNPDYLRFDVFGAPLATDPPESDCPVKRAGTLNGFATGENTIVIGGLTESVGLLSDYSAAGPITPFHDNADANRAGPDAAARSDDSPVLRGVLSAGSYSGSMVRMNGTSVAAPLVARYIGDALAAGRDADREWIHGRAKESDLNHFPYPKPADTRTGAGRLKLKFPFGLNAAEV